MLKEGTRRARGQQNQLAPVVVGEAGPLVLSWLAATYGYATQKRSTRDHTNVQHCSLQDAKHTKQWCARHLTKLKHVDKEARKRQRKANVRASSSFFL
jgi:hypothetical protein